MKRGEERAKKIQLSKNNEMAVAFTVTRKNAVGIGDQHSESGTVSGRHV